MNIFNNISLLNLNTFRVEATAEKLILIDNDGDYETISKDPTLSKERKFFLGAGSNILITKPIQGLTIKNIKSQITIIDENTKSVLVEADSGLEWHRFVEFCLENKFYGIENLALIPGSVGAAPVQNIGAYGIDQNQYFHSLDSIDFSNGKFREFVAKECMFDYRYSVFKEIGYNNYFITKVRYKLSKIFKPDLTYKDLTNYFQGKSNITAKNLFDAIVEIRTRKLPDVIDYPNAGSFFKNPVLNTEQFNTLIKIDPTIVHYPLSENLVKVSAANLIEKSGLRGYKLNNVGISAKHSLIIVNFGNAIGEEILKFSRQIVRIVFDKFGVQLEPEVIII